MKKERALFCYLIFSFITFQTSFCISQNADAEVLLNDTKVSVLNGKLIRNTLIEIRINNRINGNSLQLILPKCNGDNFQIFLDTLSFLNPEKLKIIVLDNGAFHKAQKLKIPDNSSRFFATL